jgi:ribokinase
MVIEVNKRPRILVVGSLVMDLTVSTGNFPNSGETVLGCGFQMAPGGKGANQAVQAARLGADVTMVGKVGMDSFGDRLIASCREAGVHTEKILRHPTLPSAVSSVMLEVTPGEKTKNRITMVPGANMSITPEEVAFLKDDVSNYDMVILQLEIPMKINELVAQYAYDNSVPVMLNPAPSALLSDSLLSHLTYISPNEHEATDITGVAIHREGDDVDSEDVEKVASILQERGVNDVIITLGSAGAVVVGGGEYVYAPCINVVEVKDPTAAGDSFVGAFATARCVGMGNHQALDFANYAATLTVSRMGAQPSLPTLVEVLELMEQQGYSNGDPTLLVALDNREEETSVPSIFQTLLQEDQIPLFVPVTYELPMGNISDLSGEVHKALTRRDLFTRIRTGDTVCVAVGSREIANIDRIVRALLDILKAHGALPFIVPAMGSHGGATAQGQRGVLATYGVTEERMGVRVLSDIEPVVLGRTKNGLTVYLDRNASQADWIIPIGRVKPHTDFRGPVESGLMKMIVIGLGKQRGAAACHKLGFPNMSEHIMELASAVIETGKIPFGLAILEDAFHNTYRIEAIPGERIAQEEPLLLEQAKRLVSGIPFPKIDILVLEEIGKDISGAGMDPNVTGRSSMLGRWQPFIERIAVLDITDKSHGNGSGMGHADVTTRRAFDKFDFDTTYPNSLTSCDPSGVKIPPVMPNDELAVKFALHTSLETDWTIGPRVVWMKNTLSMHHFYVSEALLPGLPAVGGLKANGSAIPAAFDTNGNFIAFQPN